MGVAAIEDLEDTFPVSWCPCHIIYNYPRATEGVATIEDLEDTFPVSWCPCHIIYNYPRATVGVAAIEDLEDTFPVSWCPCVIIYKYDTPVGLTWWNVSPKEWFSLSVKIERNHPPEGIHSSMSPPLGCHIYCLFFAIIEELKDNFPVWS